MNRRDVGKSTTFLSTTRRRGRRARYARRDGRVLARRDGCHHSPSQTVPPSAPPARGVTHRLPAVPCIIAALAAYPPCRRRSRPGATRRDPPCWRRATHNKSATWPEAARHVWAAARGHETVPVLAETHVGVLTLLVPPPSPPETDAQCRREGGRETAGQSDIPDQSAPRRALTLTGGCAPLPRAHGRNWDPAPPAAGLPAPRFTAPPRSSFTPDSYQEEQTCFEFRAHFAHGSTPIYLFALSIIC